MQINYIWTWYIFCISWKNHIVLSFLQLQQQFKILSGNRTSVVRNTSSKGGLTLFELSCVQENWNIMGLEKWTHRQTDRRTDILTYRKHRPRGPMLWKLSKSQWAKIASLVQKLRPFQLGVDFAYWWSCIGKGLRMKPVQQACFLDL